MCVCALLSSLSLCACPPLSTPSPLFDVAHFFCFFYLSSLVSRAFLCSASTLVRPVLEEREHFLDVSVEKFKPKVTPPPGPQVYQCLDPCAEINLPLPQGCLVESLTSPQVWFGLLPSPFCILRSIFFPIRCARKHHHASEMARSLEHRFHWC